MFKCDDFCALLDGLARKNGVFVLLRSELGCFFGWKIRVLGENAEKVYQNCVGDIRFFEGRNGGAGINCRAEMILFVKLVRVLSAFSDYFCNFAVEYPR